MARESLVGLFWPDATDSRARNALAQAVHVIRKELSSDVLVSSGSDHLSLSESSLYSDVRAFRADIEARRWTKALDRYVGDLLPGFHVARADDFVRWLDEERRGLRRLALEATQQAAAAAEARGELEEAVLLVRRGLVLAPFEERGLRQLMALLVVMGERAKAVTEYELFRDRLQAELGMEPSRISSGAYEDLLSGADVERLDTPMGRPAVARTASGVRLDEPEEPATGSDLYGLGGGSPHATPTMVGIGTEETDPEFYDGKEQSPWKAIRWGLVFGLVGLTIGTAMMADSAVPGPPVKAGTVAVAAVGSAGDDEATRRVQELSTMLRSSLSRSTFADLTPTPRAVARDDAELSRRHRALGIEHTLALTPSSREISFAVLDNESGAAVAVGSLPLELTDSAALDRVLGAAMLHLDRSAGDWGGLSSIQPSYAAARAFIESMRAWRALRHRDSFESLQAAVEAEPWFPLALLELVEAYGDREPGDSLLAALQSRKDELSTYESLQLSLLEATEAGDTPLMLELARRLGRMMPERFLSHGASYALDLGRYELALELGDQVDSHAALMPNADYPRLGARHGLGLHEQEYALADSLRRLSPETIWLNNATVQALAALGHVEGVEDLLREIETRPKGWTERGFLGIRQIAIKELLSHGHEDGAERVLERGLGILAESSDSTLRETDLAAWFYRQAGDLDAAERINLSRVEAYPDWVGSIVPLSELAMIRLARNDLEGAIRYADRVADWSGHETAGARAKAREAGIYAAAGQEERALTLLREALRLGLPHVSLRSSAWELRVLRDHPEFEALFPHPTF